MTIDEMFNELKDKARDTIIVTLKYKYDFEENYTIENHILEYDSLNDSYVWLNDWCEGQTDIEVLGYMLLGDVDTTKLLTCEDCISRKAVENITWEEPSYTDALNVLTEVREKVRELPSVTPQPKTGEWVNNIHDIPICDQCGYMTPYDRAIDDYEYGNFCPNCGADMRGESE